MASPVRGRPPRGQPVVLSEDARAFANRHRVARLATVNSQACPHIVPICYAVTADAFYFVVDDKPKRSRTGLTRLRNIAGNPQVAIIMDDYEDDWTQLAFLLVRGQAAQVTDPAEYTTILEALHHRYPQYRSMALAFQTHPMIRVTVQRQHLWRAEERGSTRHVGR
ncbi:MAG: TIGR03668 family PPOX class F420-dependent oxidoreductase [Candidatus Binatia bacterium]